jgi:hypothetical protein
MSDFPERCSCYCFDEAGIGVGLTVGLEAFVDVSITGLPLNEAVRVLDSVHSRRVLVPADMLKKLNKRVNLKLKRQRFGDVLKRLGLTSGQLKKKTKRK